MNSTGAKLLGYDGTEIADQRYDTDMDCITFRFIVFQKVVGYSEVDDNLRLVLAETVSHA
jgi:hypothetical protein